MLIGLIHTASLKYHVQFIGLTACYGERYNKRWILWCNPTHGTRDRLIDVPTW